MHRNSKNVKVAKTIWTCCNTGCIPAGACSLGLNNKSFLTNVWLPFEATLHLHLDAYVAHLILNQKTEGFTGTKTAAGQGGNFCNPLTKNTASAMIPFTPRCVRSGDLKTASKITSAVVLRSSSIPRAGNS